MRLPRSADESQFPLFLRREQRVEQRLAIAAIHEAGFVKHDGDFGDGGLVHVQRLLIHFAKVREELDDFIVVKCAAEQVRPPQAKAFRERVTEIADEQAARLLPILWQVQ